MRITVGRKVAAGFGIVLLFLAVLSVVVWVNTASVHARFERVIEHDAVVMVKIWRLKKLVVDMETGLRGFCITQEDEFLEPYERGRREFQDLMEIEKNLLSNRPAQVAILEEIERLHEEWTKKVARPEIAITRKAAKGSLKDVAALVKSGTGKKILDQIRGEFRKLIKVRMDTRDARYAEAAATARATGRMILILGLVAIVFGVAAAAAIARSMTAAVAKLARGAEIVGRGNLAHRIDVKTKDELGQLAAAFNSMVESRQQAEERERRLNAVLRAIRNVNQLITTKTDRDELLRGTCETLIETRGYMTAWIALFDDSGGLLTRADAGLGEAFSPLLDALKRGQFPACVEEARKQKRVVTFKDPSSTCSDCVLFDQYEGNAAMCVRLEHEGNVRGVLTVSCPPEAVEDEEEAHLLEEVARDIALALHSQDAQQQRKRAEQALRESEGRYRSLTHDVLDGSASGVFVLDADFRIVWINKAIERYFGLRREEVLGKDKRQTIRERIKNIFDDPQAFVETVFATYDNNTYVEQFECHVLPDGEREERWLEHRSMPIQSGIFAGGRIEHYYDITARKRAEEALRESRERYRALYEGISDGVLVHDGEGTVLDANEVTCARLGRPLTELKGMNIRELVTQEHANRVAEHVQRTLTEGADAFETVFTSKSGQAIQCEVLEHTIEYAGRPAILSVARDITERKQLEEQLRQSQKLEAIGQLAGGVAHDFNNMLTGIEGYVSFALKRVEPESQPHRDLTETLALAKRAEDLTRQLLAFSRRQTLRPVVMNINSLVANVTKMLKRLIGEDIALDFLPASDLGNVEADPGQIEQVLMNLAVNARDAMPKGGKLTVETANAQLDQTYADNHVSVKPGPYVMLAATDTGCGMDQPTRERIFEPFFSTKDVGEGSGLGLSTVYGIVKQHGGNIWVYSEPGKGTTFKIYLPRAIGEEDAVENAAEEPAAGGTETILVVEDEPSVLDIAARALEARGYDVLSAASPADAEKLVAEHQSEIALLVTDVVMPEASGRELYDALTPERPSLKVLYISGYTDNAIVHQGVLEPGTPFLQKPFDPDVLARKVREVLDERGTRNAERGDRNAEGHGK